MEGVLNQLFHQHKADHGNERLETVIASTSHRDKDGTSTSANISKPDEGNSKASQARIAPLNNAKAAATRSEESKGGCHIL